jgi:hypothetical protein
VSPHAANPFFNKAFLHSVKPLGLEEKGPTLGLEPAGQFLPSARSKSVINMVPDTELHKVDDAWHKNTGKGG